MEFIVAWLLEVIIIAFICGVISAVVAVNKGRSGVGWFVIGNLLGPLGLVLSLVVSKNQQAVEQAAIATGDMRKCPFCAELIKSEASVCRHCGREIKDAPQETIAQPTYNIAQPTYNNEGRLVIRICPSCRFTNNGSAKECSRCGAKLPA